MVTAIVVSIFLTLLGVIAIGIIGFFTYRFGYDKGYKEAQEKYKQPELTPEQKKQKDERERIEKQFSKLFA